MRLMVMTAKMIITNVAIHPTIPDPSVLEAPYIKTEQAINRTREMLATIKQSFSVGTHAD